jgi:hypothetical protein
MAAGALSFFQYFLCREVNLMLEVQVVATQAASAFGFDKQFLHRVIVLFIANFVYFSHNESPSCGAYRQEFWNI